MSKRIVFKENFYFETTKNNKFCQCMLWNVKYKKNYIENISIDYYSLLLCFKHGKTVSQINLFYWYLTIN